MSDSPAARLRAYFMEMKRTGRFGGTDILRELAELASACVNGTSDAQDTVAYVLSDIFWLHAMDRDGRPVPATESYELLALGDDRFSEAISFIEIGGTSNEATRIAAALARLTPGRLHEQWPPKNR